MNWYEIVFEMMKYILPLALVFAFIYFILNNYLEENFKLRSLDLKLQNQQSISP